MCDLVVRLLPALSACTLRGTIRDKQVNLVNAASLTELTSAKHNAASSTELTSAKHISGHDHHNHHPHQPCHG
ncbi:hypothetical protein Q3G72_010763 [Acer saccharum]|nr:hypothetical protein Q3G72_010763 [Acer saccharum]